MIQSHVQLHRSLGLPKKIALNSKETMDLNFSLDGVFRNAMIGTVFLQDFPHHHSGATVMDYLLQAVLSEIGRLAIQVGESLDEFFREACVGVLPDHEGYARGWLEWLGTFYPPKPGAGVAP